MPTNHIEKRIESPEVDHFSDRHFECDNCTCLVLVTQMYLLSYVWRKALKICASFKKNCWLKLKHDWMSEDVYCYESMKSS